MTGSQHRIAIVGGSGFYEMHGLTEVAEQVVPTPYGPPSDAIVTGKLNGAPVAFLARHARGHSLLPGELPQRANFWALASLGVREVISISAVGSLQLEAEPLHMVVPDQLIDRTSSARPSTFFGDGVVAHISFEEPFCGRMSAQLLGAAKAAGATVHQGGTMVVIEGPAFSTRAESLVYQSWGCSIIGMTALPEAKLAREAGMCYAALACVTDYDTWHPDHKSVSVDLVLENLRRNAAMALQTVINLVDAHSVRDGCECWASLTSALVTPASQIADERRAQLWPILDRYGVS